MRARSGEARCEEMSETRLWDASLNSMNDSLRSRARDSVSETLGVSDQVWQSSYRGK